MVWYGMASIRWMKELFHARIVFYDAVIISLEDEQKAFLFTATSSLALVKMLKKERKKETSFKKRSQLLYPLSYPSYLIPSRIKLPSKDTPNCHIHPLQKK